MNLGAPAGAPRFHVAKTEQPPRRQHGVRSRMGRGEFSVRLTIDYAPDEKISPRPATSLRAAGMDNRCARRRGAIMQPRARRSASAGYQDDLEVRPRRRPPHELADRASSAMGGVVPAASAVG